MNIFGFENLVFDSQEYKNQANISGLLKRDIIFIFFHSRSRLKLTKIRLAQCIVRTYERVMSLGSTNDATQFYLAYSQFALLEK